MRIKERVRAEAIAKAAPGHRGPLGVSIEEKRQAPPRLFDLPALQKTCGQRWGWTADKTLSVTQELYDGDGKKVITYPRAEARYLSENQISDVPGDCRRADPPARLCSARNRAPGNPPRQVRPRGGYRLDRQGQRLARRCRRQRGRRGMSAFLEPDSAEFFLPKLPRSPDL
jgi:hypothetical protein